jgi:hypothetical protein
MGAPACLGVSRLETWDLPRKGATPDSCVGFASGHDSSRGHNERKEIGLKRLRENYDDENRVPQSRPRSTSSGQALRD